MSTAVAITTAVAISAASNSGGGTLMPAVWQLVTLVEIFIFISILFSIKYGTYTYKAETAGAWTAMIGGAIGNIWYVHWWVHGDISWWRIAISFPASLFTLMFVYELFRWAEPAEDIEAMRKEGEEKLQKRKERWEKNVTSRFGLFPYDDGFFGPTDAQVEYANGRTRGLQIGWIGLIGTIAIANLVLFI